VWHSQDYVWFDKENLENRVTVMGKVMQICSKL